MDNDTLSAIETFKARVRAKEDELNRLKKAVNEMCQAVDITPAYSEVESTTSATLSSIRSDQFYGQPLSTAMRVYLEMRKGSNLSAAQVSEIFNALKTGGFKFEAKDDEVAKIGMRAALRKNSSIFHRLPNGEYGLLAWYPNAKAARNGDDEQADDAAGGGDAANYFTYDEIREAIHKTTGNFFTGDIERTLTTAFPSKVVRRGTIPITIYQEKNKGKLKVVAEKQGNKGAMYCKV